MREGEAPAEPLRRQLGRSLALPLFFVFPSIKHCKDVTGVASPSRCEQIRRSPKLQTTCCSSPVDG